MSKLCLSDNATNRQINTHWNHVLCLDICLVLYNDIMSDHSSGIPLSKIAPFVCSATEIKKGTKLSSATMVCNKTDCSNERNSGSLINYYCIHTTFKSLNMKMSVDLSYHENRSNKLILYNKSNTYTVFILCAVTLIYFNINGSAQSSSNIRSLWSNQDSWNITAHRTIYRKQIMVYSVRQP